jgi:hypothetical protein
MLINKGEEIGQGYCIFGVTNQGLKYVQTLFMYTSMLHSKQLK